MSLTVQPHCDLEFNIETGSPVLGSPDMETAGGGSVSDQSEPGSMSDSDASDDSEPFLSDSEPAVSNLVFVQIH